MTDIKFDILDELYFLTGFGQLNTVLGLEEKILKESMISLYQKSWIKCYDPVLKEPLSEVPDFESNYKKYYYLATKAGLLAHNSK